MNTKQWYETLFENYGKTYDKESFTQGTIGECDYIEQEYLELKSVLLLQRHRTLSENNCRDG